MLAVALPNAGLLQVRDVLGVALRAAYNAIRPAERNHLRLAVLETTEMDDCLLKSLDAVHVLRIRLFVWSVKYIITLKSAVFIVPQENRQQPACASENCSSGTPSPDCRL